MTGNESLNMTLIAHDTLAGWGGMGEGMVIQEASGRAAHPVARA